jgi:hypothetical protein
VFALLCRGEGNILSGTHAPSMLYAVEYSAQEQFTEGNDLRGGDPT